MTVACTHGVAPGHRLAVPALAAFRRLLHSRGSCGRSGPVQPDPPDTDQSTLHEAHPGPGDRTQTLGPSRGQRVGCARDPVSRLCTGPTTDHISASAACCGEFPG